MVDLNLYTRNLNDEYPWYSSMRVKDELSTYLDHLERIIRYHKTKGEIILDYKVIDDGPAGCTVQLANLTENARIHVYDAKRNVVHEFDPRSDDEKFLKKHMIKILDRNPGEETLLLRRTPVKKKLAITDYPYQAIRQKEAVFTLIKAPLRQHIGLLKLFHDQDHMLWDGIPGQDVKEWFELDLEVDGGREQREFVKRALATPDFAFLEGPPGSGKTIVLCELIRQLVAKEKRVLFCASTHVAVDNLLERLVGEDAKPPKNLIPLRMGDSDNISERNKPYQYDQFLKTIKKSIERHSARQNRSRAQTALRDVMSNGDDVIERLARDCANLVCGTTMGILAHPDIKSGTLRRFDVMIIDEASKTTLQEFLVPAMYADRWIIAGDTRQLAPYTDDEDIAMSVASCIKKPLGDACVDAFTASRRPKSGPIVVATDDADTKQAYMEQCARLGVNIVDADDSPDAADCRILIGSPPSLLRTRCPGQPATIRNADLLRDEIQAGSKRPDYKTKWWRSACARKDLDGSTWGEQVGWRVRMLFPYAAQPGRQKIRDEVAKLMPVRGAESVDGRLYQTEKVALPSILELLQCGFAPIRHSAPDPDEPISHQNRIACTTITDGMPPRAFEARHVLLEWQHRMHPDVAAFSNRHIYGGAALRTPDRMRAKRNWTYDAYGSRMVWIGVNGKVTHAKSYSNTAEAERIVRELVRFCRYAKDNRKPDLKPWTVAILSFVSVHPL